jgi:hypothetical protein
MAQWRKPLSGVSFSHLTKHRLINGLAAEINETSIRRENTQTRLPLKICAPGKSGSMGKEVAGDPLKFADSTGFSGKVSSY